MSKTKNPYDGVDHSDLSEEDKKARGIETEVEKEARVAKQEEEKAKKKAEPKAKKGAKKGAKKAAGKKPAAKKSAEKKKAEPKAKKGTKKGAKKGAKKPAKKVSKADAPLGLRADGEPRVKAPFDPETTMGQRGKKIKQDEFEPTDNESAVLTCVRRAGTITLTDLAERAFPKNKKANSWTRNALRRLIRARLVKKIGRGEYEKAA